MRKSTYGRDELSDAFRRVGLRAGDVVFSHSNIGFFGLPETGTGADFACQTVFDALFDVIGPAGTLVVPTFTYSFSRGLTFDPATAPSDCGIFSEFVRRHPQALRSHDPCVSVAAVGRSAEALTADVGENAYGDDGFFARFHREDGVVCNMNFDAGSTFLHYVERRLAVPYRFDKTFTGTFVGDGTSEMRACTLWVRQLVDGTEPRFEAFTELARRAGCFVTAAVGRGFVGAIRAQAAFELLAATLPKRPWLLTRAEVDGMEPRLVADPR